MASLDELRAEIDGIDARLHDLLIRRIEIGREVATAKAGAPALRPGRQVEVLRRLLARNRPSLGAATIARIWCEIMSANVSQQFGFGAAVWAPRPAVRDLARDYCGGAAALAFAGGAAAALDAVSGGEAAIAILPGIAAGAADRWWPLLLERENLNVVARLPFVETGPDAAEALVVARQEPEPSGRDRTIFAVDAPAPPAGARLLDTWEDGPVRHSVEVDGFLDRPPAEAAAGTWRRLGACAVPIRV